MAFGFVTHTLIHARTYIVLDAFARKICASFVMFVFSICNGLRNDGQLSVESDISKCYGHLLTHLDVR